MAYSTNYRTGLALFKQKSDFSNWKKELSCTEQFDVLSVPLTIFKMPENALAPATKIDSSFNAWRIFSLESPKQKASFAFSSCIASWNIDLEPGYFLGLEIRVKSGASWSSWLKFCFWTLEDNIVPRHSLEIEEDDIAKIDTDTLICKKEKGISSWQVRINVYKCFNSDEEPSFEVPEQNFSFEKFALHSFALSYSEQKPLFSKTEVSAFTLGKECIIDNVPCSSQMIYPCGGDSWCSPVSLSMITGFWAGETRQNDKRTLEAVYSVYDYAYRGHGNWSFNTAYAGTLGFFAHAVRFSSLAQLEELVQAGIPLAISLAWDKSSPRTISNAPYEKTNGHITCIVGFSSQGNPVMNEPVAGSVDAVRREYNRSELEKAWLSASGGLTYIVFPRKQASEELINVLMKIF